MSDGAWTPKAPGQWFNPDGTPAGVPATEALVAPGDARAKAKRELPPGEYWFSASQVDTFNDCKRKWAFRVIDGIKGDSNKYAEHGKRIHDKLEAYLLRGTIPDQLVDTDALIMLPGIRHLPQPGVALTELRFEMAVPGLGAFLGFIDAHFVEDGIPVNIDHKTTSSLRWALTKDQLLSNVQSVIYAVYAMERHDVDAVKNRWVYYQRNHKKPKARKVEAVMRMAEVAKHWESVLGSAREMKQIRDSGAKAADVSYNAKICDKYGGCPYRQVCGLTGFDRLRSLVMQQTMKERMAAAAAAKAAINPPENAQLPAAAAAAPAAAAPAQGALALTPLQRMQAAKAAAPAPSAPAPSAPAPSAPAPSAPTTIAAAVALTPLQRMQLQKAAVTEVRNMNAADAEVNGVAPAGPGVFPSVAERAANDAAKTQEAQPAVNAMAQAAAAAAMPLPAAPAGSVRVQDSVILPDGMGFTLYVDCYPTKGLEQPVHFVDLLAEAQGRVLAGYGVSHYKLIPDLYGGNAAVLQGLLQEILQETAPTEVAIRTGSPEANDAVALLDGLSAQTIRG